MHKSLLPIFFFLFLASCSPGKKAQADAGRKELNEKEKIEFGRNYLDGTKEKILGNYESAESFFRNAIAIDPSSAAAHYELGLVYNYQKNFQASFQAFEVANKLEPNNYWYKLSYASFLENSGDKEKAIALFKELAEQNPNQLELKYELSKLLVGENRFDEGIAILNEIEQNIGVNEEISFLKQRIFLYQNDVEGAANEIEKLIAVYPDEIRYYGVLSDIYLSNGKDDQAFEVFKKMQEIDPDSYFVHFSMAEYHRSKGERNAYLEDMKKAFENPAMNIDDKVKYVLSYYQVDSRDEEAKQEGISLCKSITIGHPDNAKSYALLADFLYFDNQNEAAKDAYKKTIELDSSRFPVWNQLLVIMSETQDTSGQIKYSKLAIDLFPNQPTSYLLLGLALAQKNEHEEAIEYMSLGKDLVVKNQGLKGQFYSSIGDSYHSLKQHDKSDEYYEKALEIDPNNVYVLNNYSYYLSLRKANLEKAKKMSLKSNQLAPGQASFQDTYAWILFQLEEYEEALIWINKAIGQNEAASPVLLEHKGDILFKLGQKEEAVKFWKKAEGKPGVTESLSKKIKEKNWYE